MFQYLNMKHLTTKEYMQFKKGRKTKNRNLIIELLKGGDNHEKKQRSI